MSIRVKDVLRILDDISHIAREERSRKRKDPYHAYRPGPQKGAFEFIPQRTEVLVKLFEAARRIWAENKVDSEYYYPPFIDAGCGIGMTLAIAELCHLNPTGLELDQTCFTRAKYIFGSKFVKDYMKKADILKFRRYGRYDIIYFWVPFFNRKKQQALEKRIARQMKPGALVIPTGSGYEFKDSKNFEQVWPKANAHSMPGTIYKKVLHRIRNQ